MTDHTWRVEWDDFDKYFSNWWHLVADHNEIVIITCCGEDYAAVVPWERWLEYTETEQEHAER